MDINTASTPDEREALIQRIDEATRAVASHMPFAVNLDADMGGTFALHIDLGTPLDSDDPDDPHDTAGIDPDDPRLTWWFNADGGEHTVESSLGVDARPEEVARWILNQAARPDQPGPFEDGPIARARAARSGTDLRPDTTGTVAPTTASPLER